MPLASAPLLVRLSTELDLAPKLCSSTRIRVILTYHTFGERDMRKSLRKSFCTIMLQLAELGFKFGPRRGFAESLELKYLPLSLYNILLLPPQVLVTIPRLLFAFISTYEILPTTSSPQRKRHLFIFINKNGTTFRSTTSSRVSPFPPSSTCSNRERQGLSNLPRSDELRGSSQRTDGRM